MSLKSTRKILSVILMFIIAAGGCLFAGTMTLHSTLCSEKYMQKHFTSERVMEQCQNNFNSRIEALSEKSGIPVRAFEAVNNFEEIKSDSPVRRLFGGHDTTLYTNDTVERFEQLCTEYLDGNSIKYDKALVHNTADEAAKIYADCFGLKNTEGLTTLINNFDEDFQKYLSISFLMITIPIILLGMLYKKSVDLCQIVCSSFTAEGIALVLSGAAGLLIKWNVANIYPDLYANAASNIIKSIFVILMLAGAALATGFLTLNVVICKKQNKKNSYE